MGFTYNTIDAISKKEVLQLDKSWACFSAFWDYKPVEGGEIINYYPDTSGLTYDIINFYIEFVQSLGYKFNVLIEDKSYCFQVPINGSNFFEPLITLMFLRYIDKKENNIQTITQTFYSLCKKYTKANKFKMFQIAHAFEKAGSYINSNHLIFSKLGKLLQTKEFTSAVASQIGVKFNHGMVGRLSNNNSIGKSVGEVALGYTI